MTRRRLTVLLPVAMLAALTVVALAGVAIPLRLDEPLAVVIRNQDPTVALNGLTLESASGRTAIPTVPARGAVTIRPVLRAGEDSLSLVDAAGDRFMVLCYFKGDPCGRVFVDVDSALVGPHMRVLDRTTYPADHTDGWVAAWSSTGSM